MYTDIQSTVTPRVEFHQGIPSDLEDDEFFDPKLNNLLIWTICIQHQEKINA